MAQSRWLVAIRLEGIANLEAGKLVFEEARGLGGLLVPFVAAAILAHFADT